jgi:hypothetical protein
MRESDSSAAAWALLGALVVARAGHWLITPRRHLHASSWTYAGIGVQIVVGLGMVGYGWYLGRHDRDEALSSRHPEERSDDGSRPAV